MIIKFVKQESVVFERFGLNENAIMLLKVNGGRKACIKMI